MVKFVKRIISFIWQLPQIILGSLLCVFTGAYEDKENGVYRWELQGGISLGWIIIVNKDAGLNTIKHEQGHQVQSLYLGWLYLLIIGLPSITWAGLKMLGLFKDKSYYSFYTEKWANKIAGLN